MVLVADNLIFTPFYHFSMDMSCNSAKDLELTLHCIKSPVWNEGENRFYNKPSVRELLYKCSGGKIIEMLKDTLSAEEKTALVHRELQSYFQFKSFENYMKMSNDCKPTNFEIKVENIKTKPDDTIMLVTMKVLKTWPMIESKQVLKLKLKKILTEENDNDYVCNYGTTEKKVTFK